MTRVIFCYNTVLGLAAAVVVIEVLGVKGSVQSAN